MPSDVDLWSEIVSVLASWGQLKQDLDAVWQALGQIGLALNTIAEEVARHEATMQRLALVISARNPEEKAVS